MHLFRVLQLTGAVALAVGDLVPGELLNIIQLTLWASFPARYNLVWHARGFSLIAFENIVFTGCIQQVL